MKRLKNLLFFLAPLLVNCATSDGWECGYDAYGVYVCYCYKDDVGQCSACGASSCPECGEYLPPTSPPASPEAPECDLAAAYALGYEVGYAEGIAHGFCFGPPEASLGDYRCNTEYVRGYHAGCAAGVNDRETNGAP